MRNCGKLPVLNLLTSQKISIFDPQGRLVAPIHVKFGKTKGARGSTLLQEISHQSVRWDGNAAPKVENFHVLVNSHSAGANPFTDFYNS